MLQTLGKGIWAVTYDFYAFGIHFPGRMTVVRLTSGDLWLCSPVPIDDELAAALAELGPVKHIVAPNRFHHVHLPAVLERYPEAALYGAPGLPSKRKDIRFDETLTETAPDAWRSDLAQCPLLGIPTFGEVVFFHHASGTLVTTDLFMNVHEVDGFMGWFVYWSEGCWRRPAVPRLVRFLVKDKARMRADVGRIVEWPIRRLVMAHGEIVESEADDVVRSGLSVFGPLASSVAA